MERKKVLIALGSNMGQEANVEKAKRMLGEYFEDIRFSRAIWTEPIGLEGSDLFLNLVASGYTSQDKLAVEMRLKEMERLCGRVQDETRKYVVALDLDLLQYGEERLRENDWGREYVKRLMGEIGW